MIISIRKSELLFDFRMDSTVQCMSTNLFQTSTICWLSLINRLQNLSNYDIKSLSVTDRVTVIHTLDHSTIASNQKKKTCKNLKKTQKPTKSQCEFGHIELTQGQKNCQYHFPLNNNSLKKNSNCHYG